MRKISKILLIALLCTMMIGLNAYAEYDFDGKEFAEKQHINPSKVWMIKFKQPVQINDSISEEIYVEDDKGLKVNLEVIKGSDNKSLLVKPKGYYRQGKKYHLYVGENIMSQKNEKLKEAVKMPFVIEDKTHVNVEIAAMNFKKITVNSTDVPEGVKFKIKDSSTIKDVGETLIAMIPEDNTTLYILDKDDNVLKSMQLNISQSKEDIEIDGY